MFDIAKYLEKFTILANSKYFLRDSVISVIKEISGIEISNKDIDVKEGIVRIKNKPIIKNEIFLKKTLILKRLKEKIGNKIYDIL